MHTIILTILLSAQPGQAPKSEVAKAEPGKTEAERFERWSAYYKEEAEKYEIYLRDGDQRRLKLHDTSLLNWTNPVWRVGTHGAFFVWTLDGRPTVAGALATNIVRDRTVVWHQLHSLATEPLVAERDGEEVWHPQVPGIQLREIPTAPQPAKSRALRMAQMRSLARRFRASGVDPRGNLRPFRLLAQPLYRSQPSTEEVLDGALFCFAMGTDPELLLLIEACRKNDGVRWCFSQGRFTDMALKLEFDQAVVWEEPLRRYQRDEFYIKQSFPTDRNFFE